MEPGDVKSEPAILRANLIILLTLVVCHCLFWWLFAVHRKPSLWQVPNDYPSLTLAHALNLENWINGDRNRHAWYFQEFHPGIPYQIASWVTYRVARWFYPANTTDPIRYTFHDIAPFFTSSQLIAFLLSICGMLGIGWAGKNVHPFVHLSAQLSYFSFQPAWLFGHFMLGNESFALVFAVLFFTAARRILKENPSGIFMWVILGALSALLELSKINYMVWVVAAGIGTMTLILGRRIGLGQYVFRAVVMFLAFCTTLTISGIAFLGFQGFLAALRYQLGVVVHTGYYGSGQTGLVSLKGVAIAFNSIAPRIDLWGATVFTLFLFILVVIKRPKEFGWFKDSFAYSLCVISALVLAYGAVLKQFNEHYLLVGAAVLPMLTLWLGEFLSKRTKIVFVLVFIGLDVVSFDSYVGTQRSFLWFSGAIEGELAKVRSLPLAAGNLRLWSYRVNAPQFLATHSVVLSNVDSYADELAKEFPNDAYYNIWDWGKPRFYFRGEWLDQSKIPWTYAIFDRSQFATFGLLPDYFRKHGTEIGDFKILLVVGNNKAQSQLGPIDHPLVTLEIKGSVSLFPAFLKVPPWGVEVFQNSSLLWLGSGEEQGMGLRLWSQGQEKVFVKAEVEAGPAKADLTRHLAMRVEQGNKSKRIFRQFVGHQTVLFPVELQPGQNDIFLCSLDEPNVSRQANGETRPILVLLRHATIDEYETSMQAGPQGYPLITVGQDLARIVGIEPRLETASTWSIEIYKGKAVLWLGQGEAQGLRGILMASKRQTIELSVQVEPGPARNDPGRTMRFSLKNKLGTHSGEARFERLGTLLFICELLPGENSFSIGILESPTILRQPDGETRPLLVFLKHIDIGIATVLCRN